MSGVRVRLAEPGDEEAICDVCTAGFTASSRGLLSPERIAHQVAQFYNVERVRDELAPAPPGWLGYAVAVAGGRVIGACGGGLNRERVGQVVVLYLNLARRGRGIGTALLDFVTAQQIQLGAHRQRVTVTEGNDLGLPFYRAHGFQRVDRVPFLRDGAGHVEAWSLVLERRIG